MVSTKFGNTKSGVYSNLWLVGNLYVPNIFRNKCACGRAVMHFSTCLYHLWEPFSVLDFIASEFCFIWLCNEVFVKWSVLWSKVLLQFRMSDHGLVTVAWDSSKICVFCNVGIEADLYDCYESACMMSLWCWLISICYCVLYDPSTMSTACINSMIEHVAWYEASCVVSPILLMCGSITSVVVTYIHICSSPEVCSLI